MRAGEGDEFLAYFPDFRPQYEDVRARYEAAVAEANADFARLKGIENPREFALAAQKCAIPAAIFALRNGKVATARAFFAGVNEAALLRWLGLREDAAAQLEE